MTAEVRPITFTTRGLTLRGTAYVPEGRGPHTTAVLMHGFGGQRTEASRAFVQLARRLTGQGIAAFAVDRMGHGESDGDFADTTVSQDVVDSLQMLEWIALQPEVNADDIHLVGISMGAVIASVVAAESSVRAASLTLWSVAAMFVDELSGGTLQGKPITDVDEDGYFDFRGLRVGPQFFADAKQFDVYGRARGYDGPVRVLHGDADFIPARYAAAYSDVYGDQMQYTLVAGADHCWENVPARDRVLTESVTFISTYRRSGS